MKRFNFLLIILLISSQYFHAQKNPRIDKETFFTETEGSVMAFNSLKKAEKYYRKGQGTYDEALKYYRKVYQYNPNSPELNYKIGICYLLSSNKSASLKHFLESNSEVAKDYYLVLGRSYQYNTMYEKAKESYEKYLNSLGKLQQNDKRSRINQLMAECDYASTLVEDSLDVFIVNLGPIINSYYDDYNAFLLPKDSCIYFTTKRPEKEPRKRVSRFKFKEQIYSADNGIYEQSQWSTNLKDININNNVSIAGIDRNQYRLFFYEGKVQNGRLMTALYDEKKQAWKKIKKIKGKINHIAYKETSISLGPDNTAYFISDHMGSEGGKDIWVAPYLKKYKWDKPYNIGNHINTPFDEEGIFISDDGNTLYFSSKGHMGMGGFDIYKSVRTDGNSWSSPINMGYPINSPADELFYHPTPDTMVALYSTIRSDSYGGLDIYKIQKDPRKPFSIIGQVTDAETGETLIATINIIDGNTQMPLASIKVDPIAEKFIYGFKDIGNYRLQINKEGYKAILDSVECPEMKKDTLKLSYALELIKHPFTLSGSVIDQDTKVPVKANLVFKDAITDTVYGRKYTDDVGHYTVTFDDKFDLIISVEAENYYSLDEYLNATLEKENLITKNISLKTSKVLYSITGIVFDDTTNARLNAILSFYRPGEEDPFKIVYTEKESGKYNLQMEDSGPFLVEVVADEYFFVNEAINFMEGETMVAKNFKLKKMSTGAKIVIENILFNTGKSTLKPESFKELNKLAILLIRNPNVRIEVSGHTDNVGSASVNKKISKARALTVKNYLVSRGVEDERMEYEGYGYDQPIAPNDTPEGRAQNRRVEIQVLE